MLLNFYLSVSILLLCFVSPDWLVRLFVFIFCSQTRPLKNLLLFWAARSINHISYASPAQAVGKNHPSFAGLARPVGKIIPHSPARAVGKITSHLPGGNAGYEPRARPGPCPNFYFNHRMKSVLGWLTVRFCSLSFLTGQQIKLPNIQSYRFVWDND